MNEKKIIIPTDWHEYFEMVFEAIIEKGINKIKISDKLYEIFVDVLETNE